jgi:hypothetical protein
MSEILPYLNTPPEETRYCSECGERFAPANKGDIYCKPQHRKAAEVRRRRKREDKRKAESDRREQARREENERLATGILRRHFEGKPPCCSERDPCEIAARVLEEIGRKRGKRVRAAVSLRRRVGSSINQ